jgi:hypothetical protein
LKLILSQLYTVAGKIRSLENCSNSSGIETATNPFRHLMHSYAVQVTEEEKDG